MMDHWQETFERALPQVERPARYTNAELFSVKERQAKVRVAFVFPDVYEIGMSNYGLRVLYHIVNGTKGALAERAFIPWMDMLSRMKESSIPLHSLETRTPLRRFDMVGISLQSELGYTNVLAVLELSGIPLRWEDRKRDDPLIVGGGPCTVNPLPLEPFFDAFLVGDGEDAIREILEVLLETKDRAERLSGLSEIEGVWVPAMHRRSKKIKRRVVGGLRFEDAPIIQVVPTCEVEHDRFVVEISRGCLRGCRFCQAGFTNRPARCRPLEDSLKLAEEGAKATGWEEVSLLSFAVSDYPWLRELLDMLNARLAPQRTAISLPSFRGEAFNERLGRRLSQIKKTGLTFAPETASVRLKRVINKNASNEAIIETARTAARLGWRHVKLYFMVGLPSETQEDIDMNIEFIRELSSSVRGLAVNVHVASFVPKPHTPFQWSGFAEVSLLEETISRFKVEAGLRRVKVKWAKPEASFVEALLARGDERLARVLEGVLGRQGYFQEWSEHFRFERWLEALNEQGVNPERYSTKRNEDESLAWDFIDTGVSKEFLINEYRRSLAGELQGDCTSGPCYDCGLECQPSKALTETLALDNELLGGLATRIRTARPSTQNQLRYRLKLAVGEALRYASHLDLVRAVYRALRRSGLPLTYTQGFSPHPRVGFGFPKPVGITSQGEYVDIVLTAPPKGELAQTLRFSMPEGLSLIAVAALAPHTPAITKAADILHYRISPAPDLSQDTLSRCARGQDSIRHVTASNGQLSLLVANAHRVKLWEVLASLYNVTAQEARLLSVERVDAYIARGKRLITPLEESYRGEL